MIQFHLALQSAYFRPTYDTVLLIIYRTKLKAPGWVPFIVVSYSMLYRSGRLPVRVPTRYCNQSLSYKRLFAFCNAFIVEVIPSWNGVAITGPINRWYLSRLRVSGSSVNYSISTVSRPDVNPDPGIFQFCS